MRYVAWIGTILFAVVGSLLSVGCGTVEDNTPNYTNSPSGGYIGVQASPSPTTSNEERQVGQQSSALTQEVQDALKETLFDEYKARATYQKVINTFGNIRPFSNIIGSEVQHANAILNLYKKYGLTAPSDPWNASKLPAFSSVQAACQAGVQAEVDNAAIYDRLLQLNLPDDIRAVFVNLRDASEDNHLQAFQRCASR